MASQYEEIEEVAKRPFNYANLKRMLRYARPYRRQLGLVVAVMVVGSMLRLMEPYLLRTAIDVGIVGRDLEVLNRVLVLWVVQSQDTYAPPSPARKVLNKTGQSILFDMRQELFEHLQWLSLRFYDGRPVGRIMSRVTNDVEAINNLINSGLVTVVSQSISLIGIVGIMFAVNARLALMAFVVLPGMVWIVARLRPAMDTAWRNVRMSFTTIRISFT